METALQSRRQVTPSILVQNSDGDLLLKHVTDKQQGGIELSAMDKYTAGIELSNACRNYYARRLRASEGMKKKLCLPLPSTSLPSASSLPSSCGSVTKEQESFDEDEGYTTQRHPPRRPTSIDKAMDKLRSELASLIDQDLALMRQLLTLNEQIEELKWQRKFSGPSSYSSELSKGSSTSSAYLDTSSLCTLGSEAAGSRDLGLPGLKYPSPSMLSVLSGCKSVNSLCGSQDWDRMNGGMDSDKTPEPEPDSTSDLGSSTELTNSSNSLKRSKYSAGNSDTLDSTLTNSSNDEEGLNDIDDYERKLENHEPLMYELQEYQNLRNPKKLVDDYYSEYEDKYDIHEHIEDAKDEVLGLLDSVVDTAELENSIPHPDEDITCVQALKAFDMVLEGIGDDEDSDEYNDTEIDYSDYKGDLISNNNNSCHDGDDEDDLEICIPPPCFPETDDDDDAGYHVVTPTECDA